MYEVQPDDVIVGIESCKACGPISEKYPENEYVCLPRKIIAEEYLRILTIKKTIAKLGVTSFPVVLNRFLTKVQGYPR